MPVGTYKPGNTKHIEVSDTLLSPKFESALVKLKIKHTNIFSNVAVAVIKKEMWERESLNIFKPWGSINCAGKQNA